MLHRVKLLMPSPGRIAVQYIFQLHLIEFSLLYDYQGGLFDGSSLNAIDRGHKPTIKSLGEKKYLHIQVTLPQDQSGYSLITNTIMTDSCLKLFIQHVIGSSAWSMSVYKIHVSWQNRKTAYIIIAQALVKNCRCPL